jgi:exopolysaccharide biosynthesis polyprenyl glycosylphosphotransferase
MNTRENIMPAPTLTKNAVFSAGQKAPVRTRSAQVQLAGLLGDTIVVFLALVFSSWLRFGTNLARFGFGADAIRWTDYFGHAAFGTLLFILLLPHRQLYDLPRLLNLRKTILSIVRAALTWVLAYMAFSWLLRSHYEQNISRIYVAVAFLVTTASFVLWRLLLHAAIQSEAIASRLRKRILFVGWSPRALTLARAIAADHRHLYDIAGYLPSEGGDDFEPPAGLVRNLGGFDDVADILRERKVDSVILADLKPSTGETMALADLCEKEMVDFKVIPSCFEILLSCLDLETVSGVPVLGISQFPLDVPMNALLKQLVDFVGGVVGLIVFAPVITIFGLLVHRESPGPIIYRQRRLGRDGRPFWMYKIRSMKLSAEQDGKVGWTVKNDPRRLRVGAFMRKWNIDELPQFWNVIKGEMSLVGPRPERPELIQVFKEEIPHYNARHSIKPGLTGWAQVNGFRGDTDLNERIRCDLYYIEHWSLLLDLQIMLMTLFRNKNAG